MVGKIWASFTHRITLALHQQTLRFLERKTFMSGNIVKHIWTNLCWKRNRNVMHRGFIACKIRWQLVIRRNDQYLGSQSFLVVQKRILFHVKFEKTLRSCNVKWSQYFILTSLWHIITFWIFFIDIEMYYVLSYYN